MENEKQNKTTENGIPDQQLRDPSLEKQNKQDDLVFFNIMPKPSTTDDLIQPTLKIETKTQPVEQANSAWKIFLLNNKKNIIIGLLTIVSIIVVYFLINAYGGGETESDIIINSNATANLKQPINTTTSSVIDPQWKEKYFPACKEESLCGDEADPDHDGLSNTKEFKLSTDPNNSDSDQDGISDGDEINVFSSNPLSIHTANDLLYSDADFIKGVYDFGTGKKMSEGQISSITNKMTQFGLHEPTIKTLFGVLNTLYNFSSTNTTTTPATTTPNTSINTTTDLSLFDLSVEAKQDRDIQRSNTIKNIEAALVKYQLDNKKFPIAADFSTMYALIKPYLKVATNPTDPINKDPYVYIYTSDKQGVDFTLSFYSEVANQVIKKHSVEAINDTNSEQAAAQDDQRKMDLESLQTALLLYSQKNAAGNQTYVFPAEDKYKTVLTPENIIQIPKDPKTKLDYEYKVSATFDTFTLKAVLEKPSSGTTGWICNQEECRAY